MKRKETEVVVGIDVSKKHLDLAISDMSIHRRFKNDTKGIERLLEFIKAYSVIWVVMEACHYHKQAHQLIAEAGFKVHIANPFSVKSFANAMGILAKTDAIDAKVIAKFGDVMTIAPTPVPDVHHDRFRALVMRRKQLVDDISRNAGRIEKDASMLDTFEPVLAVLKETKAAVETEIKSILNRKECQLLARRVEILKSIPGIGDVNAWTLCALLPELGTTSNKQISALVGVAPMNCDSGESRGRRKIKGGRAKLRPALFMSAMVARRYNPDLKAFAERKEAQGKPTMVIRVAMMRKIVVLANVLIRDDRLWEPRPKADEESATLLAS